MQRRQMEKGACSAGEMQCHQLFPPHSSINWENHRVSLTVLQIRPSQGGAAQARSSSIANQFRASAFEASSLGLTLEISPFSMDVITCRSEVTGASQVNSVFHGLEDTVPPCGVLPEAPPK